MCNMNVELKFMKKKPDEKYNDFKMIFSPFAHRHYFSFHFTSFHARFSFLDYLTFWFPNECFGSIFHYMLLIFSSFSLSLLLYILRMEMVSVDYLSVQKGNINYIAFFSCSSCATETTHTHHTSVCTHILNSLRYGV